MLSVERLLRFVRLLLRRAGALEVPLLPVRLRVLRVSVRLNGLVRTLWLLPVRLRRLLAPSIRLRRRGAVASLRELRGGRRGRRRGSRPTGFRS